jgi:hypothetical protein
MGGQRLIIAEEEAEYSMIFAFLRFFITNTLFTKKRRKIFGKIKI